MTLMDDTTMPRRKAQASLNDKWTKLLSDAEQGTIDAKTAVVGTKEHYDAVYGSNFAAVVKMLGEMDTRLEETRQKSIASVANSVLIREFFELYAPKIDRVVEKVEAVGSGLTALTDQFRETGEALNEWQHGMERRVTSLEEALAARPSIEETRELIRLIRKHDRELADTREAVSVLKARLDARPSPEEAHATYDGVRRILAHLGLESGE